MIQKILDIFQKQAFGVCEWLGEKLGLKIHSIRLFFIYLSFLTLGSPLIIYLVMAFILEHKYDFKYPFFWRRKRRTIWDL